MLDDGDGGGVIFPMARARRDRSDGARRARMERLARTYDRWLVRWWTSGDAPSKRAPQGASYAELGAEHGISATRVGRIVRGRR